MTLRDAIDKEYFYIENISYSDNDLKTMSLDELETLKMLITKKISGLSLLLKEKQADNFNEENVSKGWSMSRKRALYINQRVLVYVSSLMKKQRKKETRGLCDYFMDEAKSYLKANDFEAILQNARREMDLMIREGN
ncbi:hypothetical protein FACS189468_9180 [Spirochaetia bacterium]|nr:hypothetical protein FACS189468_9180 [Spirochaetia bacterium]